jgi:hypothetical protein
MIDAGAMRDLYGRVTKLEHDLERRRVEVPTYLASSTLTAITFDSESYDFGGLHTGSSSRLVAQLAGVYAVDACLYWNGSSGTFTSLYLYLSATTRFAQSTEDSGGNLGGNGCLQTISGQTYMAAGDYVELYAYQVIGSAILSNALVPTAPSLAMVRVGP